MFRCEHEYVIGGAQPEQSGLEERIAGDINGFNCILLEESGALRVLVFFGQYCEIEDFEVVGN